MVRLQRKQKHKSLCGNERTGGHMEQVKDIKEALGAEDGVSETLYVNINEVEIGDLLMGFMVTGVSLGQHDGKPARTFQLGSPFVSASVNVSCGRLTLLDSKDDGVIVVRVIA